MGSGDSRHAVFLRMYTNNLCPSHSAKHAVLIRVLLCALTLFSSDKTLSRLFVSFYCIFTPSLIPARRLPQKGIGASTITIIK